MAAQAQGRSAGVSKREVERFLTAVEAGDVEEAEAAYHALAEDGTVACVDEVAVPATGQTAWHVAAMCNHIGVFEWLLGALDGDPAVLDKEHCNAAHYAAAGGHVETLVWLKAHRVPVFSKDARGHRPSAYAELAGQRAVTEWFAHLEADMADWSAVLFSPSLGSDAMYAVLADAMGGHAAVFPQEDGFPWQHPNPGRALVSTAVPHPPRIVAGCLVLDKAYQLGCHPFRRAGGQHWRTLLSNSEQSLERLEYDDMAGEYQLQLYRRTYLRIHRRGVRETRTQHALRLVPVAPLAPLQAIELDRATSEDLMQIQNGCPAPPRPSTAGALLIRVSTTETPPRTPHGRGATAAGVRESLRDRAAPYAHRAATPPRFASQRRPSLQEGQALRRRPPHFTKFFTAVPLPRLRHAVGLVLGLMKLHAKNVKHRVVMSRFRKAVFRVQCFARRVVAIARFNLTLALSRWAAYEEACLRYLSEKMTIAKALDDLDLIDQCYKEIAAVQMTEAHKVETVRHIFQQRKADYHRKYVVWRRHVDEAGRLSPPGSPSAGLRSEPSLTLTLAADAEGSFCSLPAPTSPRRRAEPPPISMAGLGNVAVGMSRLKTAQHVVLPPRLDLSIDMYDIIPVPAVYYKVAPAVQAQYLASHAVEASESPLSSPRGGRGSRAASLFAGSVRDDRKPSHAALTKQYGAACPSQYSQWNQLTRGSGEDEGLHFIGRTIEGDWTVLLEPEETEVVTDGESASDDGVDGTPGKFGQFLTVGPTPPAHPQDCAAPEGTGRLGRLASLPGMIASAASHPREPTRMHSPPEEIALALPECEGPAAALPPDPHRAAKKAAAPDAPVFDICITDGDAPLPEPAAVTPRGGVGKKPGSSPRLRPKLRGAAPPLGDVPPAAPTTPTPPPPQAQGDIVNNEKKCEAAALSESVSTTQRPADSTSSAVTTPATKLSRASAALKRQISTASAMSHFKNRQKGSISGALKSDVLAAALQHAAEEHAPELEEPAATSGAPRSEGRLKRLVTGHREQLGGTRKQDGQGMNTLLMTGVGDSARALEALLMKIKQQDDRADGFDEEEEEEEEEDADEAGEGGAAPASQEVSSHGSSAGRCSPTPDGVPDRCSSTVAALVKLAESAETAVSTGAAAPHDGAVYGLSMPVFDPPPPPPVPPPALCNAALRRRSSSDFDSEERDPVTRRGSLDCMVGALNSVARRKGRQPPPLPHRKPQLLSKKMFAAKPRPPTGKKPSAARRGVGSATRVP